MELTEVDVATLATLAGNASAREVLASMAAAGHAEVRASHGYVFQRLIVGEPTIGELADALGITQQGASKHVAELERLGYAERVPDARDQRVRRVRMTVEGRDALAAGRAARADLEKRLIASAGLKDVETARRVLIALLEVTGGADAATTRSAALPS
jgi:DNA-binding MarR family transcriptional regulator